MATTEIITLSEQRSYLTKEDQSWPQEHRTIGIQVSLHQFSAPDASGYDRRQRWFDVPCCWTPKQLESWLWYCFEMPANTAALRYASGLHFREDEVNDTLQHLSELKNTPVLTLSLTCRLNGGKGGFGANLKSAGGRMANRGGN